MKLFVFIAVTALIATLAFILYTAIRVAEEAECEWETRTRPEERDDEVQ